MKHGKEKSIKMWVVNHRLKVLYVYVMAMIGLSIHLVVKHGVGVIGQELTHSQSRLYLVGGIVSSIGVFWLVWLLYVRIEKINPKLDVMEYMKTKDYGATHKTIKKEHRMSDNHAMSLKLYEHARENGVRAHQIRLWAEKKRRDSNGKNC